ncbi:MAG: SPOR domain-containing protein [Deltaproteobacteria bacterium]|jgi:cell division septation protein DedD|nr:SPOR domain-containing protein [Deltaproteobacteria bacterium]
MAEKRRESSGRHGWPAAIAVVSLVVAAGFGIGVVAGITWEEPGLVVGYLTGQTEGVEWSVAADDPEADDLAAGEAVSEPPSVAAAPPLGLREVPDAASSERARSEVSAAPAPKAVTAAAQPATGFAVQVGAFSDQSAAKKLADSLRARGYAVYLAPTEGSPTSWRVRVGPVATRPEAENTARRLEKAEKLPTWVLGEGS